MNTEEKILAILEEHSKMFEKMQANIGEMQADMGEMQANMGEIQANMGEMQANMGEMQKTLTRVAVTQENVVLPKLQLLAEGHDTLLNTLARKERVEALEDDVALLKTVIKAMSQRIENLEKAGSETA